MGAPSDKEIQRLRESEEKYRKMIERANDAILAIDIDTAEILEANPKTEEMTGYSVEELVGKKVWDLHPREEHEVTDRLFQQVSSTGQGTCAGLHFLTKSGEKLEIDVSASVIEYGDKKLIQRICRDVSQRVALEQERDAQRNYYEYILNMLPVGLGVKRDINRTPTVEFENNKIKEMFTRYEKDGLGWHETLEPGQIPTRAILDDTGVYAEERRYPDGRIYQFTLSYYRNLENSWSELLLVRDVTRPRQLEEQVEAAKEDLEQKVEERTLEVRQKQAQLVQSEKMAALGHLVAGVAHEINTPLGALKSNNDLQIRSIDKIKSILHDEGSQHVSPELDKLLEVVDRVNGVSKEALDRIVAIVTSLRKFARLDEAERDLIDLHEGLDSTLNLVHHELKNRITVHKEYAELPTVYCFPNQINQVFMNILVNAGQAIEGKGDIYVKTSRRNDTAVVEFRDTGKGIPKENIDRIFDPGFTTKGSGIGTGLGLSIVYQIIKDHDGEIEVESEVGKGTTVRILLPIKSGGGK